MGVTIGTDYSERYRELHVAHLALLADRYRDQRMDTTRQVLSAQQQDRVHRARELNLDLGQHVDNTA